MSKSKTPDFMYPRYNPSKYDNIINGRSRKCSHCNGTGLSRGNMMVPLFQDLLPPNDDNKTSNKNIPKTIACQHCKGTGTVPFFVSPVA